jgi:hypothetical protein
MTDRLPWNQPSQAGERGEDLTDFSGVFEPIIIVFSVTVVAHHIGQAQRPEHVAHAREKNGGVVGVGSGLSCRVRLDPVRNPARVTLYLLPFVRCERRSSPNASPAART